MTDVAVPNEPPAMRRPRPGSVQAALSYRDFRIAWIGSFASNIGTWMQNVVLPAYVYGRTGNATITGLLVFAQLGPMLVLSIPAGVFADKFDRRRWLISVQLVQLAFSIGLAAFTAADASLTLLFLMQLGVGIGNALNAPAWSASLPALVGRADLPGAISLNSTMINGSRVIGPIIVALLAPLGVTTAQFFAINAATYLTVVVALLLVHIPRPPGATAARGWQQFTAGIRIARARRPVARILVSMFTFSLISLPYVGLFPAVAEMSFGIDEKSSTYNWLYATWGLGACLGGLAIGTVFVTHDKRRLARVGFAAFAVLLAGFAVARSAAPAFAIAFLLGIAYFATTTSLLTVLQSRLEDAVRGRVLALWFMAFGGTVPLGNLAFGPVMDAIGARWVLALGAAWALLLAWWCDIGRIDRESAAGHEPLGHALQPRHA